VKHEAVSQVATNELNSHPCKSALQLKTMKTRDVIASLFTHFQQDHMAGTYKTGISD